VRPGGDAAAIVQEGREQQQKADQNEDEQPKDKERA
jgi:hypothetical protein